MPTVLLCHCDGTNGSTTFTDVSPSARTLTAGGSAAVSTAQVKFGTGAANFTAGNSWIDVGGTQTDFQFGSSPFTIEAWGYNGSGTASIFSLFLSNGAGDGFYFGLVGNSLSFWYQDGSNVQQKITAPSGSFPVSLGVWHHLAVDRDAGGTVRVYIDGVIGASASAPTFWNSTLTPEIGNAQYNSHQFVWPGYIDEVRVTKGTALYAGAFTPPTAPFPDGGAVASQARAMVLA
jgi:Concanavalin A-like lectin/glucanases superfamily